MSTAKKKSSIANRRLRGRSKNLSFLFVLFFFALFVIIIVMETVLPKPERLFGRGSGSGGQDDEDVVEEYYDDNEEFNFDTSFEERIEALKLKKILLANNKLNISYFNNMHKSKSAGKPSDKGSSSNSSSKERGKNLLGIESDWQEVVGASEKFFVYSAYYVNDHIKVIGATRTHSKQRVQCRLYDNQTHQLSTVDGRIKSIRENWNMRYSACFIICNLPSKSKDLQQNHPTFVSVTTTNISPSARPSNYLRIQYAAEKLAQAQNPQIETESDHPKRKVVDFSLCIKPIYLNYDNVLHFLETMEFHRIMGVEHFTFFNHSIGPRVGCIMNQVYNSSLISILPWSLPFVSQKEIRTEGIFAALNDCVYRHRGTSKYLVIVDLDESIVPRKTNSYKDLVTQLITLSNQKKIGAYSFQNAFFYLQFDDDPVTIRPLPNSPSIEAKQRYLLAERVSKKLITLRKTRRRARFHPHKERSKYICDPNRVIEAGNHFVWEMEKGYFTLSVPTHLAALHHYRVCEFGGSLCIKSPSIVDKTVQNFSDELINAVTLRLEEAGAKCGVNVSEIIAPGPSR